MLALSESAVKVNKRHKNKLEKNYYGYLFTAPFIIVFLTFSLYPLLYTFYLSITNATAFAKTYKIVGLDNFTALFKDGFFIQSFVITWKLWLINFIPQIGIAMLLAVWFTNNRLKLKGVGVWRTLYYLPNLLMPVTIAVLFTTFFGMYGPINQILARLGIIQKAIDFSRSGMWMSGLVEFIQWWMWFGSTIIIIMAGMTSISPSYYESAMVDGATARQMFNKITLPLLKPILVYTLVTSLVGGMQMFDIPYAMTDGLGAPNGSLRTMTVLLYTKFSVGKGYIGAAAAVGVLIFVITSIVAFAIMKLLSDKDPDGVGATTRRDRRRFKKGAARI